MLFFKETLNESNSQFGSNKKMKFENNAECINQNSVPENSQSSPHKKTVYKKIYKKKVSNDISAKHKFLNEYFALSVLKTIANQFQFNIQYPDIIDKAYDCKNNEFTISISNFDDFVQLSRFPLHPKNLQNIDPKNQADLKKGLIQARILNLLVLNFDDHRKNYSWNSAYTHVISIDFDHANSLAYSNLSQLRIQKILEDISGNQQQGNVFCGSELNISNAQLDFLQDKNAIQNLINLGFKNACNEIPSLNEEDEKYINAFEKNSICMLNRLHSIYSQKESLSFFHPQVLNSVANGRLNELNGSKTKPMNETENFRKDNPSIVRKLF